MVASGPIFTSRFDPLPRSGFWPRILEAGPGIVLRIVDPSKCPEVLWSLEFPPAGGISTPLGSLFGSAPIAGAFGLIGRTGICRSTGAAGVLTLGWFSDCDTSGRLPIVTPGIIGASERGKVMFVGLVPKVLLSAFVFAGLIGDGCLGVGSANPVLPGRRGTDEVDSLGVEGFSAFCFFFGGGKVLIPTALLFPEGPGLGSPAVDRDGGTEPSPLTGAETGPRGGGTDGSPRTVPPAGRGGAGTSGTAGFAEILPFEESVSN